MSQPHVLQHSHTPFKKREGPPLVDLSTSDAKPVDPTRRASIDREQKHVHASGESSCSPEDVQQASENTTSDEDDEDVSGSTLEEELERAEFDPFVEFGNILDQTNDYGCYKT